MSSNLTNYTKRLFNWVALKCLFFGGFDYVKNIIELLEQKISKYQKKITNIS